MNKSAHPARRVQGVCMFTSLVLYDVASLSLFLSVHSSPFLNVCVCLSFSLFIPLSLDVFLFFFNFSLSNEILYLQCWGEIL